MLRLAQEYQHQGISMAVIPYGGSNLLGAMGFVRAMKELANQCAAVDQWPTHVVFASSSGGTHAGMEVGKALFQCPWILEGIAIDKQVDPQNQLSDLISQLMSALWDKQALPGAPPVPRLHQEFLGDGYGVPGSLEREAMALMAQTEGILLDPVYTARAAGALFSLIRQGYFSSRDRVLFWHTGGAPALFAYGEQGFLPELED
jgi:D-cysteine desulfhydrase